MKTRLHKFFSAALALCLVLTLNVTLCAAAGESDGTSGTSGSVISVTVPTTGSITVNPYEIEDDSTHSTAQIIHQAQSLVNNSACDVSVNVSAIGTFQNSSSAATFIGYSPDITSTYQRIHLYVEFGTDQNWAASYDETATNQLLIRTTTTSKNNVMTLTAGGTGYFHFNGAVSAGTYPMWSNDTDAFTVTLAFTFTAIDTGTEDEGVPSGASLDDEDLDDDTIQPSDETSIISGSEGNDNVAATPADNTQPAAPTDSGEDDQTDPSNDATQPTETDESGQDDPAQSGETGETGDSAQDGQNDQSSNPGETESQGTGEIIEVTNPTDDAGNTSEDSTPET
jgi:hypothetical protein